MIIRHIRKAWRAILAVGLALATIGAVRLPPSGSAPQLLSTSPGACFTQMVRITLAGEQFSFCAPTSLPFDVVEDSRSDPLVNYAGLNQGNGYAFVNIKATLPGNRPGMGRPLYTSGGVNAYRQAVWILETAKTDRSVSNGPSGIFWNETVPGVQVDVPLPTSAGNLKVRSIEWYVEHDGRLWSFIFTWDTDISNAGEWQAASGNISVQKSAGAASNDTAIDLGEAYLESQAAGGISSMAAPGDVDPPPWWSGTCDDNNYYAATGVHSVVLGASWHGLSACGTNPMSAMIDRAVQFFPNARWQLEFECVELVMRFLYLEWGIAPFEGNGNTMKDHVPSSSMVFYPNDGSHKIVTGDVITEDASVPNPYGHTVIVTDTSLLDGATGTGSISILEQNASSAGHRPLYVQNWQVQPDSGANSQIIQGWLHARGNQDDGNPDQAFTPGTGPDGPVNAIALKPSTGKIMIAGDFSSYNGTPINRIARLNIDGSLDTGYTPGTGVAQSGGPPHVHVYALAVYLSGTNQGKVLIGGHFDSYSGSTIKYIARLNSDGSLDNDSDTPFTPAAEISSDVYTIAIQSDGKILVGGAGLLRRLNSDGSLDASFTGVTDKDVNGIVVKPGGKILIGGNFSNVDGTPRAGIARLKSDGTLDTAFDPGSGTGTSAVNSLSLDPDGRLLIGGNFTTFNSIARNKVARLNNDGSLDTTFNPGTGFSASSDFVQAILAQMDGKILVGGNFHSYNGVAFNYVGRLNYDGSPDTSFSASLNGLVRAMALQADGNVILGGDFTNHLTRLLNFVVPCYSLTTQVIPAAGGSISVNTATNCPASQYLSGTLVQVTALLNPDYWLFNWSGDASGSDNPLSLIMNSNKTVTANLMASPGHFNKLSPGDGSPGVPDSTTLSWEASTGATSYKYCLDMTNDGACDSNNWISTGTNTSVSLSDLLPSVTYYWQVRARNQVDTTYATGGWWSFTRNGIPPVPVTVSPGGMIINPRPAYIWNASIGATSYHVIVYSISASANIIDDDNVPASVCSGGTCTYQPAVTLPPGDYAFKVAATATDTSDFSPWRTFSEGVGQFLFLPLISSPGN